MQPTRANQGTLPQGTLLLDGRFKVLSLLGGGGMGEVYVAEQTSLGRKVALKVLRTEMGSVHGMTERFKREALLLSSVDHPSVVKIIDFGQSGDAACLVMELVEGETLDTVLRQGPLPAYRAARVLRQLAEGLAAVHAKGIVHRDLKPQNVILCDGPTGEQARLLDFGIARLTENDVPGGGVTQAGIVIGTPEYLSPEQAVAGKFDERSDLYSLGILAYQMLSCRLPYPGPSPREFIIQHATKDPVPLLEAAPQLAEHPGLAALVMKCLEKRPEDRPASAASIAATLLTLPGAPAAASGVSPVEVSGSMVLGPPSVATPAPQPAERVAVDPTRISQPALAPAPVAAPPAGPVPAPPLGRDFVPTAPTAPKVTAGPSRKVLALGGAGLAAAVLLGVLVFGPASVASQMRKAIDDGRPRDALEALRETEKENPKLTPELWALRGEALHGLGEHAQEWKSYARLGKDFDALSDGAFKGLFEDFGQGDGEGSVDEDLLAVLEKVPKEQLKSRAGRAAKKAEGTARYGATRIWDKAGASKGDAVDAWTKLIEELLGDEDSLKEIRCRVLGVASRRLGELGDEDAVEVLERLKDSPRPKVFIFQGSCGQDEAEAALRKLKKKGG